jgi:hypothetical protein
MRLGAVDEFHSKKCFELYLYAVKLAEVVNAHLDAGDIVFRTNAHGQFEQFKHKFAFYGSHGPLIIEKWDHCGFIYFGATTDNNGKVWLSKECDKKQIKGAFSQFRFVRECSLKSIKY